MRVWEGFMRVWGGAIRVGRNSKRRAVDASAMSGRVIGDVYTPHPPTIGYVSIPIQFGTKNKASRRLYRSLLSYSITHTHITSIQTVDKDESRGISVLER